VLLTCPTCRSGLEVPDGTDALVRCPACKTVFSPAAGQTPLPIPELEPEDEPRPRKPAKRRPPATIEQETAGRDFEPGYFDVEPPRKRRRFDGTDEDTLGPAERRALKAAFTRAAWGCKLIWISFSLFMTSMMFIIIFWFQTAFSAPEPVFITLAGLLGLFTWITGAAGVGLCLSGPPSPGHWGYGIAAAVATVMHLVMLAVLVGQGTDYSVGKEADPRGPTANWGLLPTRLDAVAFYITLLIYHDEEMLPKGEMTLSIVVGVMEMLRNLLILMLLSCLARATGEEDLAAQCTRASGFTSLGPAAIAVGMLLFAVAMIETNMQSNQAGKILFTTVRMGTYAIFCGMMFPGMMASRYTADACDEPYQSRVPKL
jgi:LSD1 subclass zinc finger protein